MADIIFRADQGAGVRKIIRIMRGDAQTHVVRFVIPRYESGVDLAPLTWYIRFIDANGEPDIALPDELHEVTEDEIRVRWTIDGRYTAEAGSAQFELRGVATGADGDALWRSGVGELEITEGLNFELPEDMQNRVSALDELIINVHGNLDGVYDAMDAANGAAQLANNAANTANASAAAAEVAREAAAAAATNAQAATTSANTASEAAEQAAADANKAAQEYAELDGRVDQLSEEIDKEEAARNAAIAQERNRAVAREDEIEALFSAPTQEAVNNWLNDHPEATTTVQDKSLGIEKFTVDAKNRILNDYVTPEMFGAKGDGSTDDTEAVNNALLFSREKGCPVVFAGKSYVITETLHLASDDIIRGIKKQRSGAGTALRFTGIATGASCIVVGTEKNDAASRVRSVTIEDLYIYCNKSDGVYGTSVLAIGDVSGVSVRNVRIINGNQRSNEFDISELDAPLEHTNYGIKFSGDSEFPRFEDVSVSADIPIYSIYPPDFADFYNITTDCGVYGYAHYYGAALCGNTTVRNASLNRGIYGFKFVSDDLPRLSGVFNVDSFRIEQLRRFVSDGKLLTQNFCLEIDTSLTIPRNYNISNGKIDGNGNGFCVTGGNAMTYYPSQINITGVSGIKQTHECDHILDMTSVTKPVVRMYFVNCNIHNGGYIYVNPVFAKM